MSLLIKNQSEKTKQQGHKSYCSPEQMVQAKYTNFSNIDNHHDAGTSVQKIFFSKVTTKNA